MIAILIFWLIAISGIFDNRVLVENELRIEATLRKGTKKRFIKVPI